MNPNLDQQMDIDKTNGNLDQLDASSTNLSAMSVDSDYNNIPDDIFDNALHELDVMNDIDAKNQSPLEAFENKLKSNNHLPSEIKECFITGLDAAMDAGELILKYINDTASKSQSIITKMNKLDFQTQFDSRTERLIISKIRNTFKNHNIVAEENTNNTNANNTKPATSSSSASSSASSTTSSSVNSAANSAATATAAGDTFAFNDNVTWIIDPIDGTTNFLHGHNNVGICIGIKYKKKSILGIVYIPIWRELFFGVHGNGAYMMTVTDTNNKYNNKIDRIYTNSKHKLVASVNDLSSAMVLLESGYKRSMEHIKLFTNIQYELLYKYHVRGIRMFGCCSVHMCMIACGRADIFFETGNLKPWDMVAGEVIVGEAGGFMTLANGNTFVCTKGEILCCQSKEAAQLMVDLNILQ